ncbi:MAG: PEP-CTERM sorting domain-containing protein [Methylococcaceae bacterium]|jgi:hypothetical protein
MPYKLLAILFTFISANAQAHVIPMHDTHWEPSHNNPSWSVPPSHDDHKYPAPLHFSWDLPQPSFSNFTPQLIVIYAALTHQQRLDIANTWGLEYFEHNPITKWPQHPKWVALFNDYGQHVAYSGFGFLHLSHGQWLNKISHHHKNHHEACWDNCGNDPTPSLSTSSVPEPSLVLLFSLSLLCMMLKRYRPQISLAKTKLFSYSDNNF